MCPPFDRPESREYVAILAHYLAGSRIRGEESPNHGEESVRFDRIGLGSPAGEPDGPSWRRVGVQTYRAAVVLTVGMLLIAGCTSSASLDSGSVQEQIAAGLAAQAGGTFTVDCPAAIPAQQDYTFTCTATDHEGGQQVSVTVSESDDAGAFTWQVSSVAPAS